MKWIHRKNEAIRDQKKEEQEEVRKNEINDNKDDNKKIPGLTLTEDDMNERESEEKFGFSFDCFPVLRRG